MTYLRDLMQAAAEAIDNNVGQEISMPSGSPDAVVGSCRDERAQDTNVQDDEQAGSEEKYFFEGQEYTLQDLQQLCENRSQEYDRINSQLRNESQPSLRQQLREKLDAAQQIKDSVCRLVEQAVANRANNSNPNPSPPQTTNTSLDLTQQEALADLDAASANLSFGSSLGLNTESSLALSRKSLILNLTDYGGQTSDFNNYFSLEKPLIQDKIKYFYNSFYSLENNNELVLYKNKADLNYLSIIYVGQVTIDNSVGREGFDLPIIQDGIMFRTQSGLKPVNNTVQNNSALRYALINGDTYDGPINQQSKSFTTFEKLINPGLRIEDDTFRMDLPFENSEIFEDINVYGASIIDSKSGYNFYVKEYEKIATNSNVSSKETTFPNLYILTSQSENFNFESQGSIQTQLNSNTANSYFDNFGIQYNNFTQNQDVFSETQMVNKNIIFLTSAVRKLNQINEKKYSFPMFNEFSIPTNKTSNILKMFYNSDLMDSLIIKLSDLVNKNMFQQKQAVFSEMILNQQLNTNQVNNIQFPVSSSYSSKRINIKEYSLRELMIDLMSNSLPGNTRVNNFTVIGDTTTLSNMFDRNMNFVNSIRRIIFQGQLMTFLKNNSRNYIDILNGKTSYNETLVYRIAKYEANGVEPIQNFWIPNDDSLDFLNIVDTQIKYEKEYVYKIYAYQLVIGTHYFHSSAGINYNSPDVFDCITKWQTNPKIIEVEMLSVNRRMTDSPPLSPEIEFVPYFGIDNKIGLFLNTRTGREKLETINILETDVDKTSLYQKDRNNLVSYEADDLSKRYEIMKLDKKPRNYSDFKNGVIKIAEYDFNPDDPNEEIAAASIIDDIIPNKKYYYCFRSIDIHDNISNPTCVYELEMINQNGMIFPIIKKYEFETTNFETSKQMRRFIKIKPQLQHYLLDTNKPEILNSTSAQQALSQNFTLGMDPVCSPWGQTFKMVATSKQTGRKIEIKFKFKYTIE